MVIQLKKFLAKTTKNQTNVYTYFKSNNGIEFVGTMNGLCTLENGKITKYDKNGVSFNSTIYFIMQDKENNYWLGTNDGVIIWDGDRKIKDL